MEDNRMQAVIRRCPKCKVYRLAWVVSFARWRCTLIGCDGGDDAQ